MNMVSMKLNFRRMALGAVAAAIAMAGAAGAAQAQAQTRPQTLRLRQEIRTSGGPVKLGQIASITGIPDRLADRLARLVVIPQGSHARQISAAQVLFALASHGHLRGLLSTVQVSGADRCKIIRTGGNKPNRKAPTANLWANARVSLGAPAPAPKTAAAASASVKPGVPKMKTVTLAGLLRKRILHRLHCTGRDVRMTFQTLSPVLDQPLLPGQTWHFHIISGQYLGIVEFDAKLLGNSQLLRQLFATVLVHKKIRAMVSSVLIRRGDVMTAVDFKPQPRWIDRNMPTLFTSAKMLVGQQAIRTISPGTMLDQRDFKPVELVHRGETVTVHIVSGDMHVKTTATARQGGGLNAIIALKNANGKTFNAVVIGRDQARLGSH